VITGIVEVTGSESGKAQMQELFRFEPQGRDRDGRVLGRFAGCNAIPAFYDDLREAGILLDLALFDRVGDA
jgi:pilus assembly protein CpaF